MTVNDEDYGHAVLYYAFSQMPTISNILFDLLSGIHLNCRDVPTIGLHKHSFLPRCLFRYLWLITAWCIQTIFMLYYFCYFLSFFCLV